MLLTLVAILSQASFTPLNHKPLPPDNRAFVFVAMGDNRPAGAGLPPTATFREILKEISLIDPAFVLSGGDLLYGNEESIDQYNQEIAWMKPLIDQVPCPFYNVPGNHEINGRPEFLDAYNKKLGPCYGEFDYGGIRFLAVCTELPPEKPGVYGGQLAWLRSVLDDPKPTVTFQHHPVFARETNDEKDDAVAANAAELHQLFVKGGVKVAFEAHDHVYNRQTHDGIAYIIAGGSGAPLDAVPAEGGFFNYVLVHVKDSQFQLEPLPLGSLEAVQLGDGTAAVGDYSAIDIPIGNLLINSSKKPTAVSAGYRSKTGKTKTVPATLLSVAHIKGGYVAQVSFLAAKHRAVVVHLTY